MSSKTRKSSSSTVNAQPLFPHLPRVEYINELTNETDITFIDGKNVLKRNTKDLEIRCFVSKMVYRGEEVYVKIYRDDERQQERVHQELKIYQHLHSQKCQIIPQIKALITQNNKITGFISQALEGKEPSHGRYSSLEEFDKHWDLGKKGLRELHGYGVLHGDVSNMMNIIIVGNCAMFFDFEISRLLRDVSPGDVQRECEQETDTLVVNLRESVKQSVMANLGKDGW